MQDLFKDTFAMLPDIWVLRGFADSSALLPALQRVLEQAPLRRMQTSRGFYMSVQNSNCGPLGWISDRRGYRYSGTDPQTGEPWPVMPEIFSTLAAAAADHVGYEPFAPDACLINRYLPGTSMGLHQDRDEASFDHPIVSVSLGISARFYVTGAQRRGRSTSVDLHDGDVMVFGDTARMFYHGVRKLKESTHPQFGSVRWNLTFRKAA